MYILILTGILFIIFIFCIYKAMQETYFEDNWLLPSIMTGFLSILAIILESIFLIGKPLEYKKFKIQYDTIKETVTEKDDIRDTNYTLMIIGINEKIRSCREFIDSKWIGIFQNKKICELELINKEEKE